MRGCRLLAFLLLVGCSQGERRIAAMVVTLEPVLANVAIQTGVDPASMVALSRLVRRPPVRYQCNGRLVPEVPHGVFTCGARVGWAHCDHGCDLYSGCPRNTAYDPKTDRCQPSPGAPEDFGDTPAHVPRDGMMLAPGFIWRIANPGGPSS